MPKGNGTKFGNLYYILACIKNSNRAREFLGDSAFDQLSVYEEPNYKTQNKYKFIRLRKKCLIAPAT